MMNQRYIAVENIVRKAEIACNKQFLFFSQCFPPYMALIFHFKMSSAICFNFDQSKILLSGNGVKNIVEKGENAHIHHFATIFHILQRGEILFLVTGISVFYKSFKFGYV